MNKLEQARETINKIDKQMAELFEQRMKASEDVIAYKMDHNLEIFDPSREKQVIEHNKQYIHDENLREYYTLYQQYVMDISKRYQKRILHQDVIAYPGTFGSFSHIAAKEIFDGSKHCAYATFDEVFEAVINRDAHYGVVPFENSYTGEVGEVLDLLLNYDVHIMGMYDLKVDQNLLGVKGAKISDIKQVYSHRQGLSQCTQYLKGRNMELIPYPNTALAAEYVSKQGDKHKAAIASKETAEIFHLDLLEENINTSNENTTRFIIISTEPLSKGDRFNMLFTVHHDAGELANIMQLIAAHGFNMESIRSRSLHNKPWQYYFYVELVGNIQDDTSKQLLQEMEAACESFKLLGSYHKERRV